MWHPKVGSTLWAMLILVVWGEGSVPAGHGAAVGASGWDGKGGDE